MIRASRGETNILTGNTISDCDNLQLYHKSDVVKMTITKKGVNGWKLEKARIQTKLKSKFECNFEELLDSIFGGDSAISECRGNF